jgi:hypothetical protein
MNVTITISTSDPNELGEWLRQLGFTMEMRGARILSADGDFEFKAQHGHLTGHVEVRATPQRNEY